MNVYLLYEHNAIYNRDEVISVYSHKETALEEAEMKAEFESSPSLLSYFVKGRKLQTHIWVKVAEKEGGKK